MNSVQSWLLPLLIITPFITGFLCWLIEKIDTHLPRWIALIGMLITFAMSLMLWNHGNFGQFLATQGMVDKESLPWIAEFIVPWIPAMGVNFHLAADGLSLLMVALTAFLGVMAVGCSWGEITRRVGFFHLNLLWSLGGVIGVFLAIDLFLFFFFWEMMLLPIYFLIALWGHDATSGKTKEYAAKKFFIYTQVSGLIMLIGIFMLVLIQFSSTGVLSFDYQDLLGVNLGQYEYAIMLCFFIGFAVKLPVFPLHGWLPDAHAQAPTAGSVDLAGILIKTAAFGLLRFVLPLFPNASAEFAPIAIVLGLIGVFYGAFLAFAQTDIKRLLAYTSISHMGFVILAIYAGSLVSLQGLMVQMLAHGLSSAALFIMAGQVYERLHTRDMSLMGGMWGQFRYLPVFLMFFSAALLGIPSTGNFVGEILIVLGSFAKYPMFTIIAAASFVFAGLYALIMIYQTLFGKNTSQEVAKAYGGRLRDLSKRELSLLSILAIGLLWMGLYPQPILNASNQAMGFIGAAYHQKIAPSAPIYGRQIIDMQGVIDELSQKANRQDGQLYEYPASELDKQTSQFGQGE